MINTMKIRLIFPFVLLIYSLVCQADGGKDSYIFRKVDYQQGLSNSAVLCLFQDNTGLMWFGTYDGVNCYDGRSMEVFRSDFSAPKALSNNVIHSIQQADNNCLWVSTHLGINRLSQDTRQVVKALTRLAGVENIVFCCNRSTADHIITSPLFTDPTYERIHPDYTNYTQRFENKGIISEAVEQVKKRRNKSENNISK